MIAFNEKINKYFPKELQLLLLLLKKNQETSMTEELITNINWNTFIELTIHHRVFPMMYHCLKDNNKVYVPQKVIQFLKTEYQKNVFRMLQLTGETEHIANAFDDLNIPTLFLKGPVLAAHLYGDISLRTSSDLDVLIPIDKLKIADEFLLSIGYVKDDYIQTVLNDWKWRHHHLTYYHPRKNIKIEIHWRLNPGPANEPSFRDLWNRRQDSQMSRNPIYMLGNEDLFLFLVSHGSRHGWSRLRWLLDIDYLTRLELDWTNTGKLLKKNDYLDVGGQALVLASALFNTKMKSDMELLTKSRKAIVLAKDAFFYIKQMINLHSESLPKDIAIFHKKHLFSLMSVRIKCLFILSFLFPYPEDAETLPLPKYLHFLYFPLRPLLWAWRWGRKHALS